MELVHFNAADGVELHGALYAAQGEPRLVCDAVILLHGAGGNFYASSLWAGILPALRGRGLTALAINTRGHDAVCTLRSPEGPRRGGAAFEVVDECRHDVRGAVDFLAARGHRRIALLGHSLGALKAIYSQAHDPHENVTHVVVVSPPLLSYKAFCAGPRRAEFLQTMSRAEQLVAAGEGAELLNVTIPLPLLIAATAYVDKYGPAERYDLLRFVGRVSQPAHYIFGRLEVVGGSEAFAGLDETMRQLAAASNGRMDVSVVEGADHFYSGCLDALRDAVANWPSWQK